MANPLSTNLAGREGFPAEWRLFCFLGYLTAVTTQQVLPAEPSSAAAARRLARDVLHEWDEAGAIDVVSLLVSELVTNAVLHAGSPVEIRFRRAGRCIRVEIADGSTVVPSLQSYGTDAVTGRGLGMVEMLTADWGVDVQPGHGKVVWFEVPAEHVVDLEPAPPPTPTPVVVDDEAWVIRLLSVPVQLFRAMQQHTDALLREYTLMALNTGNRPHTHLDVDRTALPVQLQTALERGHSTVDLVVSAPSEARKTLGQVHRALEEADELAVAGKLLTGPALPEIRALRAWMMGQLRDQLDGLPPVRWSPPVLAEERDAAPADLGEALRHLATAVVVADDQNRIAFLNGAAERLLGWTEGGLAGQRLTTIIPSRLHDAHISGYSRYLVTGEARLIGHPVRVPALRRDGSEIEIDLVLNSYRHNGGRRMFVAALQEIGQTAGDRRVHEWLGAVDAVLDVVGRSTSLAQVAATCLQLAGERFDADVALLWLVADESMACRDVWERRPGTQDAFVRASERMTFGRGGGLPGRTWSASHPVWLRDLVADANFPRAAVAIEAGLRSGVAVPVVTGDEVVGVVELFSRQLLTPDPQLTDVLASFGRALGIAATRGSPA